MTSAHPGASLTATPFVDKIDPFKKGSLKRKPKKSQGSSRYRSTNDVELQALPLLKDKTMYLEVNTADIKDLLDHKNELKQERTEIASEVATKGNCGESVFIGKGDEPNCLICEISAK
ncbi:uncharacterized protein LOC118198626 [Stegodyphus dumicola]|uniref:uncharacterized protein LOC118198626 n=1 Tax=Stegodyphus dumicola TaxID=202533 RepID=UPI0015B0BA84|nr:uncharacterized protein LOC118198626 [Stegodyphus dumicola]